jgi:serine/threonine protein kinase
MFPFLRSYIDSRGQEIDFRYITQLKEDKAIYLAQDDSGRELVVKFVKRYNAYAHRLLASPDFAPQLRYSCLGNAEAGTMGVVIMDYVRGEDAYRRYGDGKLPGAVYDGVKEAVDALHAASFVFGDLRLNNIIITTDGERPVLVDFDWCGLHGMDRYPSSLNDFSDIKWHGGVVRNGLMLMEHDVFMLEAMQPTGLSR